MNKYSVISVKNIYIPEKKKKGRKSKNTRLKHVSALKTNVTYLEAVYIVLNYPYHYWSKYKHN